MRAGAMKRTVRRVDSRLTEEYGAALRDYLGGSGEAALERAYELGRRALAEGLGALDMARLHHKVLKASMPPLTLAGPVRAVVTAAEKLFAESLTPYEMTHRGFREANAALRMSEARYRELFEPWSNRRRSQFSARAAFATRSWPRAASRPSTRSCPFP